MNANLIKSTVVGALGGLLFGFDTAVIAGATQALTELFHLNEYELGVTVSIALIGTVIGAIIAGPIGQRLGGRNALRGTAILYIISALGCALAANWPMFLVCRFIGGLGIGGSSVLGPVYIAELAPAKWRGRLVGTFQINVVVGILLAYLSNYAISLRNLGPAEWRWELGVAGFPALLFFVLLFTIPQSARWLVTQHRESEALSVLTSMGAPEPKAELAEISEAIHLDAQHTTEPLFQSRLRLPIFLAVSIGFFNQLSGINAILYYLRDIFGYAGFNGLSGNAQSVLVGGMNLLATLIGMSMIDKFGRKTLLLIGSVGTAIALAGVAGIFLTNTHQSYLVWLLMGYIAFFAISQGAVIWVYISEVFPTAVRSKGQSLGSSAHWIMNAAISFAFPQIAKYSRGGPFLFFAAMMVLQFLVVLFVYPETKQVSLEQLQHKLGIA